MHPAQSVQQVNMEILDHLDHRVLWAPWVHLGHREIQVTSARLDSKDQLDRREVPGIPELRVVLATLVIPVTRDRLV